MKKNYLYVMDPDGTVRQTTDKDEFTSFMEDSTKKVLVKTPIYNICEVVTYFLGKEPRLSPKTGKGPFIFETRVFGGIIHGSSRLYTSYSDSLAGHKDILRLIKISIN